MSVKPIDYSSEIRPEDTEKAKRTISVALFPSEDNPSAIEFGGTCPRCGDATSARQWLIAVAGAQRFASTFGGGPSRGDETVDLDCACGVDHPHTPKGKSGCGARYRVRAVWP